MFQSTRANSPLGEGVEIRVANFSLTGSGYSEILSRSGRLRVEVEGVKPDDFTMASTSKRFFKGG